MPKRTDIKKILIIGSGPIVVGQACEFDYSGSQAIKALKRLGYEVVLVNSNPATIMTDPELAQRTYIEPLEASFLEQIIAKERPQAMLPILGGQTALNLATKLSEAGILEKYSVELIGADAQAIKRAEDRELFKEVMDSVGIKTPKSFYVSDLSQGLGLSSAIGFPLILRASFTLGGLGSSIVYSKEELVKLLERGLEASPIHTVLMEEYLNHWKEFELELMRDLKGNQSVVASIENFDPMGVHTGDSITVCPAQTLTDREYQRMREMAFKAYEAIGIACGGSNVQFAVNPKTGEILIIEINPRVSRSSALASKATGFPIAKIAAMLSVGLTLDEIPNDITGKTVASFEPALDYVVVKIPRFHFEKFPGASTALSSQMKSIGEVMALGRSFPEASQKALRSLEQGFEGLKCLKEKSLEGLWPLIREPNPQRVFALYSALFLGVSCEELSESSGIDPWFLSQMNRLVKFQKRLDRCPRRVKGYIREAKSLGFSDSQISEMTRVSVRQVKTLREKLNLCPLFYDVDTCAGEFEAQTPYFYSTYEKETDSVSRLRDSPCSGTVPEMLSVPKKKVIVLGSGPNRIGQGIEFDYVCVHAVQAIREEGLEAIMINSNPETVSTDYDTANRLYFEPIALEEILSVVKREEVNLLGLVLGFGGQTPLLLAHRLEQILGPQKILGTSVEAIDRAEDRKRFGELLFRLGIRHPKWVHAKSLKEAEEIARSKKRQLKFPLLVRPSYVLGGRGMRIFYEPQELTGYLDSLSPSRKLELYMDEFLEDALELDVDLVSDGKNSIIAGIMEHIEEAGIHSGDSSCLWPPIGLTKKELKEIERISVAIAKGLGVIGLCNIQMAILKGEIFVLEANPRASRTIPFISKARNIPWAKIAAKLCLGKNLKEAVGPYIQKINAAPTISALKVPVFSWDRFPGTDILLGPEMKSTGELMTIATSFPEALLKAKLALHEDLPSRGKVLFSLRDTDKSKFLPLAKRLVALGFEIIATKNTARFLRDRGGIDAHEVFKLAEGRPNVVDVIQNKEVVLVVNSPSPSLKSRDDGYAMRTQALLHNVTLASTPRVLKTICEMIGSDRKEAVGVSCLQEIFAQDSRAALSFSKVPIS